jgi:hypothetical protein
MKIRLWRLETFARANDLSGFFKCSSFSFLKKRIQLFCCYFLT